MLHLNHQKIKILGKKKKKVQLKKILLKFWVPGTELLGAPVAGVHAPLAHHLPWDTYGCPTSSTCRVVRYPIFENFFLKILKNRKKKKKTFFAETGGFLQGVHMLLKAAHQLHFLASEKFFFWIFFFYPFLAVFFFSVEGLQPIYTGHSPNYPHMGVPGVHTYL